MAGENTRGSFPAQSMRPLDAVAKTVQALDRAQTLLDQFDIPGLQPGRRQAMSDRHAQIQTLRTTVRQTIGDAIRAAAALQSALADEQP